MTLRNRTLLFIGLTLFALILILYSISRGILHSGFGRVEKDLVRGFSAIEVEDAQRNVSRVTDALKMKIDNLSVKASDWAQWDDTYKFVIDKNKAFIESNLKPDALLALKINFILIFNRKGEMVFGIGLNTKEGREMPLPESLKELLKPGSRFTQRDSAADVMAGAVLLRENPLMLVSRPILKSDASGPVRGAVIFGRYLDDVEFENLGAITHLALTRYRADQTDIPEDFLKARAALSEKSPIFINPLDEKTISGYTEISDVMGKTALLLRVDIPRDIHRQGRRTVAEIRRRGEVTLWSLVVSILVSGIILGLVILVILEKLVLSRVGKLSKKTVEIGASGDFSGRVAEEGKDEIYSLAASINKMLSALDDTHKTIEAREREMRLIMDTIPAGLLSLDENYCVNPEYSKSAKRLLSAGNAEIKGRPFTGLLGLSGARENEGLKLREYLDIVRQELAPASTLAELNPFDEFKRGSENGDDQWLRISYFLIHRGGGKTHHLLTVLEDITDEKTLEFEVAKSHKENLQLKAIAEDPDLFREFLIETRQILKNIGALSEKLSPAGRDLSSVHEIFRGVHTIKGVAGSFGLFQVAEVAGEFEDRLETLRNAATLSEQDIGEMKASMVRLNGSFSEVAEGAKRILGDDLDSGSGIFLRISLDELKKYMNDIRAMAIDETLKDRMIGRIKEEILSRLKNLISVPARRGLARSLKIVPGLIERLGKKIRFDFEGQETAIDCEIAHELNTPLIHLLRNACDHGIELPEERVEKGKPEEGVVSLSVGHNNGTLQISLSDDGTGLNEEKIRSVALKKGIISPDELRLLTGERVFGLIFRPGFSTMEKVSEVSGRGVGMDAVLQSVRGKLKGEIEVDSRPGAGTRFTIRIPA